MGGEKSVGSATQPTNYLHTNRMNHETASCKAEPQSEHLFFSNVGENMDIIE